MYFLTTQSSQRKEHAVKRTSADAPVGVLLIKKQTESKEFLIMVCTSLVYLIRIWDSFCIYL